MGNNSFNLENVPTYCLVDALSRREGVDKIPIAPYVPYKIIVGVEEVDMTPDCGPVSILVIWD